jgi:putative flippase GtrA
MLRRSLWRRATRPGSRVYLRYVMASGGALLSDLAVFSALLNMQMLPGAASATGYACGILVHWLLSSRLVFADAAAAHGFERTRQKTLFVGSALVGLALTTGIVSAGALLGIEPLLAKLAAVAISFQTTYLARRAVVFRA